LVLQSLFALSTINALCLMMNYAIVVKYNYEISRRQRKKMEAPRNDKS